MTKQRRAELDKVLSQLKNIERDMYRQINSNNKLSQDEKRTLAFEIGGLVAAMRALETVT